MGYDGVLELVGKGGIHPSCLVVRRYDHLDQFVEERGSAVAVAGTCQSDLFLLQLERLALQFLQLVIQFVVESEGFTEVFPKDNKNYL